MSRILFILLIIWGSLPDGKSDPKVTCGSGTERIIGGSEINVTELPYNLQLEYNRTYHCGGTIYSADYVLTAARCVYGFDAFKFTVRLGGNCRSQDGEVYAVSNIILHPGYEPQMISRYDLAVLRLAQPLVFSDSIQNIPLGTILPPAGILATLSGWGDPSTDGGYTTSPLRKVELPIIDPVECQAAYEGFIAITPQITCAGQTGSGPCVGDNGNPLAVGGELVGLVSGIVGCGEEGNYGLYMNLVDPELRDFILQNTVPAEN